MIESSFKKELIRIQLNYREYNYNRALQLIERYLDNKEFPLLPSVLNMYVNCKIKLGHVENLSKNIEFISNLFPDYYKDQELVMRYIESGDIKKSEEMLNSKELEENNYFYIAKQYMYYGEYSLAIKWFDYYIENAKKGVFTQKATFLRNKVDRCFKGNSFIEMSYPYYRRIYGDIKPGCVIFAKHFLEDLRNVSEEEKHGMPYMVWKVKGQKVYASPITTRINKFSYVISKDKYPNIGVDRRVKDQTVIIDKYSIETVNCILDQIDFEKSIKKIYESTCFGDYELKEMNKTFMDLETKKLDVSINNVITVFDKSINRKRIFYILNIDRENLDFEVVELLSNNYKKFKVIDKSPIILKRLNSIIEIFKLNDEQKEDIEGQMSFPVQEKRKQMVLSL